MLMIPPIGKNDFGDGSTIALPTFLGMTIFFPHHHKHRLYK
jgi:hypothetical protein